MGCLKLTYQEENDGNFFQGLWKKSDGSEKSYKYYPFGLTFNSYERENGVVQDYKYNGKELQDELNLQWLDYGARMYMSDIGRWGVVDAKAEKYLGISSYAYVANIPTKLVDPNGMEIDYDVADKKEKRAIKKEIRELKRSSETFRKEWREMKKDKTNTYTVTANKNVDIFLGDKSAGKFVPGFKGGNILINTGIIGNEGKVLTETIAEEFTHAKQHQEGNVMVGELDKEFEAKTITGVILEESKNYDVARKDIIDRVPFMYGYGLSQGSDKLSNYDSRFNLFLGIVDNEGGYNGNTSETPGAVTKDDPKLLKKLIKQ